MLGNPIDYLSQIEDPRRQNKNLLHPLHNILTIAVCAAICGYVEWVDVEDFGHENRDFFETILDLPNGIPSHDTFGKVMKRLDKDQLNQYFSQWMNHHQSSHPHIAIDGKFVQGSHKDQDALQIVSAFACDTKLVLAQVDIKDKTNEIGTLPELLKLIDVQGSVVTGDAMYCQKDITAQISRQKGDYIFALKNNHKSLYEDVSLWMDNQFDKQAAEIHTTTEKAHGRIETRRYALSTAIDWLENKTDWSNLNAVLMVESTREIRDKSSTERRYYLTSLVDLKQAAHYIREHWQIENSQHWVLDVIFGEDHHKRLERNEKANKALLLRTALNLIRANGDEKLSVKRSKMRASQNNGYLKQIILGEKS